MIVFSSWPVRLSAAVKCLDLHVASGTPFACAMKFGKEPLLFALRLHAARADIRRGTATPRAAALAFLHGAFRPDALWWPLVEASRVLLLTGVLALVEPGSLIQIFIGVVGAVADQPLDVRLP